MKEHTSSLLLILFVALSLNLHLLGALGLKFFSSESDLDFTKQNLEIEVIEKETSKNQNFVSAPENELEDKVNDLKNKADFLSKRFKRVQEQRVASQSGLTANRYPLQKLAPPSHQMAEQKNSSSEASAPGNTERLSHPTERQFPSSSFSIETPPDYLPQGVSTINEYIPNVKTGYFTALNTDKFTYYSFFSRINEQVRPRWENQLRRFRSKLTPRQLSSVINKDYITTIEIILDKKGYMKQARVLKSSGLPQMDEAPVLAFEMASPFLNPPKDLIDSEGLIYLQYGFLVQWSR